MSSGRGSAGLRFLQRIVPALALATVPILAGLLAATPGPVLAASKKAAGPLPWTVKVDVYYGANRNREIYRSEFAHAVAEQLIDRACFTHVVVEGQADLVLEVQLNEFITEQDYMSNDGMIPGQGEIHELRAATASVNLDYWVRPNRKDGADLQNGHVYRQITREPQSQIDDAEARALHEMTLDASRWIARDVCSHSAKILQKGNEALAPPKP